MVEIHLLWVHFPLNLFDQWYPQRNGISKHRITSKSTKIVEIETLKLKLHLAKILLQIPRFPLLTLKDNST